MKKSLFILGGVIILAMAAIFTLRFLTPEDDWICVNNEWVKHGNPSAPEPVSGCGEAISPADNIPPVEEPATTTEDIVVVDAPRPMDLVISPLSVKGKARGYWFFEASFPVRLEDETGQVLARGIAQAQSDWMTEEYVPFTATLEFNVPTSTTGLLVLEKDNPSGLPENADRRQVHLRLAAGEAIAVKAFFGNSRLDPEASCFKVFPVERQVEKTAAIGQAALNALLAGLTESEKGENYFTSINDGVVLEKLTIDDGVARAEFNEELERAVGGSCRVSAIRAQIEETLKQFPSVKSVVISIEGRTEDILQP